MFNKGLIFVAGIAIALYLAAIGTAWILNRGLGLSRRKTLMLAGFLMIIASSEVLSRLLTREQVFLQSIGSRWVIQAAMFSFAFMLAASFTMFALCTFFGIWFVWKKFRNPNLSLPDTEKRRVFSQLSRLTLLGLTTPLFGLGIRQAVMDPALTQLDIPLPSLPPAFHNFHIVQVSDLHLIPIRSREFLQRLVDRVNALEPDLIALTGDIADGYVEEFAELLPLLSQFKAKFGVFLVTGNHEYYWDAKRWCQTYSELGFQVLNNRHILLEKDGAQLAIVGICDSSAEFHVPEHKSNADLAFQGIPPSVKRILLAHQPQCIHEALRWNAELQLSGHTHGGQVLPIGYFIRLSQPFVAGLHRVNKTWIYVSCGAGFSGAPVRLGTRSEITSLHLIPSA